jgi:siroheme synthase-like protein
MSVYPVYLTHLDEQRAVVIGAGPSAERKVKGLLDADARVTLIATDLPEGVQNWWDEGAVDCHARAYRNGDLKGAALVIVTDATDEERERILKEARERNVIINITGEDEHSTFANGAVVRRGPLVLSISTSGAAPSVSVRIREKLSREFGPEYEDLLTIMNALRDPMQSHVSDFSERRDRWYAILDSDALDLLRDGRREAALARIESIVGPEIMKQTEGCM